MQIKKKYQSFTITVIHYKHCPSGFIREFILFTDTFKKILFYKSSKSNKAFFKIDFSADPHKIQSFEIMWTKVASCTQASSIFGLLALPSAPKGLTSYFKSH